MTNWLQATITQGFGVPGPDQGHSGIDFAEPNNTPLYFPVGGTVVDTSWYAGGGRVAVQLPGSSIIEYFLHLNSISVKPGDTIQAGQIVGYSGGGIGDNVLKNGIVQAATSQADFQGNSSGYHTHFGLASGGVSGYWQALGTNNNRIDPTQFISDLRNGLPVSQALSTIPGGGTVTGNTIQMVSSTSPSNPLDVQSQLNTWFTGNIQPVITNTLIVGGVLILAIILLLGGILLLSGGGNIQTTQSSKSAVLTKLAMSGL
jgi:murein DD-endopeptidase MepM/ murein hydrolase activator NlpD